MKKVILSILAILLVGVAVLFAVNGKSNYPPYKVHYAKGISRG